MRCSRASPSPSARTDAPAPSRPVLASAAARHAELGELRGDDLAVRGGIDLLVDVQDAAVKADEKRPARGERLVFIDDAIGGGDGLRRIAQERIVEAERLRKRLVGLRGIDAGGKVGDVEPPDLFATLTE